MPKSLETSRHTGEQVTFETTLFRQEISGTFLHGEVTIGEDVNPNAVVPLTTEEARSFLRDGRVPESVIQRLATEHATERKGCLPSWLRPKQ